MAPWPFEGAAVQPAFIRAGPRGPRTADWGYFAGAAGAAAGGEAWAAAGAGLPPGAGAAAVCGWAPGLIQQA